MNSAEHYGTLIRRVFDLVESRLKQPLRLEDIARQACLSPWHLHRVVQGLTGYPLMEYVRRRRLAASLPDLLDPKRRILDIALEYGFGYEQSYIRSFRKIFGMSPGQYRRRRPELGVVEPMDTRSWSFLGSYGLVVNPSLVHRPVKCIYGLRHRIDERDNEAHSRVTQLANQFLDTWARHPAFPSHQEIYAGLVEHSGQADFNWYVTGIEVPRPETAPPPVSPLVRVDLPACSCMVFTWIAQCHPRKLLWTDISEFYRRIFEEFMYPGPWDVALPWHLEEVDGKTADDDHGIFRVLVPVKAKTKT